MKLWTRITLTAIVGALILGSAQRAQATSITVASLHENFEGLLTTQWADKNGVDTFAKIVVDPLNASNHVLTFSQVDGAGTLFSINTIETTSGSFTVSFDYLGQKGTDASSGGFFGIALYGAGGGGTHEWMAGTDIVAYPGRVLLIDDGTWHHYEVTFTNAQYNNIYFTTPVYLMFEDYGGVGSTAYNAFFDNIAFGDTTALSTPEPASAGLCLIGCAMMATLWRRRRQA